MRVFGSTLHGSDFSLNTNNTPSKISHTSTSIGHNKQLKCANVRKNSRPSHMSGILPRWQTATQTRPRSVDVLVWFSKSYRGMTVQKPSKDTCTQRRFTQTPCGPLTLNLIPYTLKDSKRKMFFASLYLILFSRGHCAE